MFGYYNSFPPYVTVAEKKERNAKLAKRLAKGGKSLKPIVLAGRTIAKTFWGKAWCDNIESYNDYANRLPRGRSYVREGAVLDLRIGKGRVSALVAGSSRTPYEVEIDIKPLSAERWKKLKAKCTGKISSLVSLIQGDLPPEVLAEFCSRETGLFPEPSEIKMSCSCPDYATLCKHVAAVLYGIGSRLDEDPSLFFTLRNVDGNELVDAESIVSNLSDGVESEIAPENLENVFGVAFDELPEPDVVEGAPKEPGAVNAAASEKKAKSTGKTGRKTKAAVARTKTGSTSKSTPKTQKSVAREVKWTAKKLAKLRTRLGMSRAEMSRFLGVSYQTVMNWEKEKYPILSKYFAKLNQLK
ncbi:MAG: SWIM zinc finger family protein [Victivallaceae bacterium]|nr:SWIM zinc finger family protein [Victivallaceae bacterium]